MILHIDRKAHLSNLSPKTESAIKTHLTMSNPAFEEAEKRGRWTGHLDANLCFFQQTPSGLIAPRGSARQLIQIAKRNDEEIQIIDNRRTLESVDFQFNGELRNFQVPAVKSCLSKDFGVLVAPTGSGKTCMALYMMAQRKQPCLVLVHNRELLAQWKDRIKQFLGVDAGIIGNGKRDLRSVTVSTVQSLVKCAEQVAPYFGYLILDECHRAPAMQYISAVEAFDCRYMTGLSATPYRRDGLSKVIFWHIGNITGQIEKADLLSNGHICSASVYWSDTGFRPYNDPASTYAKALSELTKDSGRNNLIVDSVAQNNGHGVSLILSDRKIHCETLASLLNTRHGITAAVLTGSVSQTKRQKILENLQSGDCRYLIATGQLIGEGFDLPAISSMYLTTPIKYHGRLIQTIGRCLRPAPGKKQAEIYDFLDSHPVFEAGMKSRLRAYRAQGIMTHRVIDS